MRSIPILSKGTCISGRGRKGAFGEAGGFTNWHSRQAAHHRRTFSWMSGQKKRAIKRFSVAAWPRCPAIGLQWAAWKSISRRLFGTNNWVVSCFDWASCVTRYNLSFNRPVSDWMTSANGDPNGEDMMAAAFRLPSPGFGNQCNKVRRKEGSGQGWLVKTQVFLFKTDKLTQVRTLRHPETSTLSFVSAITLCIRSDCFSLTARTPESSLRLSLWTAVPRRLLSGLHANYCNQTQVILILHLTHLLTAVSWVFLPLQTSLNHAPLATVGNQLTVATDFYNTEIIQWKCLEYLSVQKKKETHPGLKQRESE